VIFWKQFFSVLIHYRVKHRHIPLNFKNNN